MEEKRIFVREDSDYEDISEYVTSLERKYKLEDLIEVYNMPDCPTECMPTMKQTFEYGVLTGMLKDLENEVGEYYEKLKERWNSILEKEKQQKKINNR